MASPAAEGSYRNSADPGLGAFLMSAPHLDLDDVDFYSPDVQVCPFPFYRALRESRPVYQLPGTNIYVLSRHRDVLEAFTRPNIFSSHRPSLGGADPEFLAILAHGYRAEPTLTTSDPPAHTKYRKLIKSWFTASAVAAREPELRDTINELIDAFAGDGQVEFVGQFAEALPARIVGDFLGQPREMAPQLKRWARDISQSVNPVVPRDRALEYTRSSVEFQHYFAADMEAKQASPGADFLSFLVNAMIDGEPISMEALLDYVRVFITGGNDTVTSLLSNTMYYLLKNPDQLAEVQADRSMIPAAVEETIRYDTPGQFFTRLLEHGDAVVGGVTIPQGSRVLLMAGSANRDEQVFPDPDRFDIHRSTTPHLAYGHGIHFCLGAPLARLEARISFELLLERLPGLRPAIPIEQVRFIAQPILRQVEQLPLEFDRA
jgi:cytochrome P450